MALLRPISSRRSCPDAMPQRTPRKTSTINCFLKNLIRLEAAAQASLKLSRADSELLPNARSRMVHSSRGRKSYIYSSCCLVNVPVVSLKVWSSNTFLFFDCPCFSDRRTAAAAPQRGGLSTKVVVEGCATCAHCFGCSCTCKFYSRTARFPMASRGAQVCDRRTCNTTLTVESSAPNFV